MAWYAAVFDGHDTYFGVVSTNGHRQLRQFTTVELDMAFGKFGGSVDLGWHFEHATLLDLLNGTA